ncbi:MAG: zinc dependent phospholipase C family protein [Pseudomonadota bacterium]
MKSGSVLVLITLALFPAEALAWGLQTHLFFAQHVLLALPLADPELRRAALRLPRLVLAGACLPDLSLAGRALGTPAFRHSHRWAMLRRFAAAACDEERAVALGYASHLLADVPAHNQFVPEHEARIGDIAWVTHAVSEWAMDEHVREAVFARAGDLLDAERAIVAPIVARHMRCSEALARRAMACLARAERLLRRSALTRLCRAVVRRFDHHMAARFEAYLRETEAQLAQAGAALEGAVPAAEAEPESSPGISPGFWRAGRLLPPRSLSG